MDIRRASADGADDQIAKSTVQRIMEKEASATLEQLEKIARALELSPYQLLIPDLHPTNPLVVAGATLEEQALYRKIAKEAVREALAETQPPISRRPKK